MNKNFITALLCIAPVWCYAAGGDVCINEHSKDAKEYCYATTRVNSGNCEHIQAIGTRMSCLSAVKHKQRELVWAVKPLGPDNVNIRLESSKSYIWMR
jgi:hypothetical protein